MTSEQLKAIKKQTESHSTFPVEVVVELLEHIEDAMNLISHLRKALILIDSKTYNEELKEICMDVLEMNVE